MQAAGVDEAASPLLSAAPTVLSGASDLTRIWVTLGVRVGPQGRGTPTAAAAVWPDWLPMKAESREEDGVLHLRVGL